MEGLYLNNFRIALPVAFPATRQPTRLPTLPFLTEQGVSVLSSTI